MLQSTADMLDTAFCLYRLRWQSAFQRGFWFVLMSTLGLRLLLAMHAIPGIASLLFLYVCLVIFWGISSRTDQIAPPMPHLSDSRPPWWIDLGAILVICSI